jgi:hypothetical protein
VVGHRGRHVDAHEVERPERRALGAADEGTGELVDLVGAQAELLCEPQRDHQPVHAQPVGDERGRVAGHHRALAQVA